MNRKLIGRLTVRGALRVPEITAYFWAIKALSTAMGESTSDYLVHAIDPGHRRPARLRRVRCLRSRCSSRMRRYIAWTYWLAVVGVGVFGTMAADVLHVGFGVPYAVSTVLYAVVAGGGVRSLAADRGDALDPQRRHAPTRGVLLGGGGGDIRDGYRARRPDRDDLQPRLLRLRHAVRRRDRRCRPIGYWRFGWNPIFSLLVRLRRHPASRRLVRRLDGQAAERRRAWLGRWDRRDRADDRQSSASWRSWRSRAGTSSRGEATHTPDTRGARSRSSRRPTAPTIRRREPARVAIRAGAAGPWPVKHVARA